MKTPKKTLIPHIVNFLCIFLIIEFFLCSMMLVRRHARDNCFVRIEETTAQVNTMFEHAMDERLDKLTVFADILAANNENPEELLQTYMGNFCKTQYFYALCIHRANGTTVYYGDHPHGQVELPPFQEEVARLPYVSQVFFNGPDPEESYVYQAVPIVRDGTPIAVLYGYMSLDVLPTFVATSAYEGRCQLYVVDGDTGNFLMDEYHGQLGNIYDGSMSGREPKAGYDKDQMIEAVRNGENGFFVFRSQRTGQWYYTYYMPMGINNWSMQLTIDEPTAFRDYNNIQRTILALMVSVVVLMLGHVLALMAQSNSNARKDRRQLRMTVFINNVQRRLLNAHNHPALMDQALEIMAKEMQAESAWLMSVRDGVVTKVHCWPGWRGQPDDITGHHIQVELPGMYELLSRGTSTIFDCTDQSQPANESTLDHCRRKGINRLALVPIRDTDGNLRGVLAAVNFPRKATTEWMEAVTYDFYMAISNLENHEIIRRMGVIDYLTGVKNRNSYETELPRYGQLDRECLCCVFVDVNGLCQVNNAHGHKAGDIMLCAVADGMRKVFGQEYIYRLGGDEFVAFVIDSTPEMLLDRRQALDTLLAEQGYSVSTGFACARKKEGGGFDMEPLIAKAEADMYREKWEYYERNQIPTERDHFPTLN